MAEDFYHLLTVQHLLDEAVHNAQVPLLLNIVFGRKPGEILGYQQHDTGGEDGDHGKRRVEQQHGHQGGGHGDGGIDDLGNALAQELAQGVHVVGVDGHDVTVSVGVEILDGQGFHPPEQVVSQVAHGALSHGDHDAVIGIGRRNTQHQHMGTM